MKFLAGKDKKEKLIEQILLENYNRYYRLAFSYVHNDADAADIVQNGAYRVILKANTLRQKEYAATWVYRIMLNEIFRFLSREKTVSMEDVQNYEKHENPMEHTCADMDLKAALNTLSKEDKAVVELRYFEDLKLEEIAQILNENLSTVKSRLYRSMKKLRIELEEEAADGLKEEKQAERRCLNE